MCFALYLGSDNDLNVFEWNTKNPQAAVHEIKGVFASKPKHFTKKNVYSVSSSETCGCGFRQETDVNFPDLSEIESKNKNQKDLFNIVNEILDEENFVELFGCWAGGEQEIESQREIQVDELIEKDFYFNENELIKVTK